MHSCTRATLLLDAPEDVALNVVRSAAQRRDRTAANDVTEVWPRHPKADGEDEIPAIHGGWFVHDQQRTGNYAVVVLVLALDDGVKSGHCYQLRYRVPIQGVALKSTQ
ncbi:hypothetical protein PIIN_06505 [Serendipita indica DSM 11827]|uniref:Uncharacterized protein n=1 Tax=Serendipita indica (strain DSM 11827) TaxID=1109443 RepID=G4TMM5_SERID|nr:hypothetical protein PIIN_06505 [Serendipita indica DSM 11827]